MLVMEDILQTQLFCFWSEPERTKKKKKTDVSSQKTFLYYQTLMASIQKETVVHLKQSDISRNLEHESLIVISYARTWTFLWHWWALFVISALKDIFTNQPHCWTRLALSLCSILFLSEFLMFLGMAIFKRAAESVFNTSKTAKPCSPAQ